MENTFSSNMDRAKTLTKYFNAMLEHLGPSHWWPGESPFEIAIGAILTQNTSWKNVEKALENLKTQDLLSPVNMLNAKDNQLSELIRPSGFFQVKTKRLRNFLQYLENKVSHSHAELDNALSCLHDISTPSLREELLQIKGIGPETADCILLYSLERPVFVIDTYTWRMCTRHGFLPEDVRYAEMQEYFMDVLPLDVHLYNEYHALIVRNMQLYCKKTKPLCHICPLGGFLE